MNVSPDSDILVLIADTEVYEISVVGYFLNFVDSVPFKVFIHVIKVLLECDGEVACVFCPVGESDPA